VKFDPLSDIFRAAIGPPFMRLLKEIW